MQDLAFPIDEKGLFDIFNNFAFVRNYKGAIVFPNCDTVFVQYQANTGKPSPGFIVPLITDVGQSYVLETSGFLHEGKKAFIYGEGFFPPGMTGTASSCTSDLAIVSTSTTVTTSCSERL